MEFMTLGKKERKILLTALSIPLKGLKCRYCNEKVKYENCSILPAVFDDFLATIACGSPVCISQYLEEMNRG